MKQSKKERDYQRELIDRIKRRFPGCKVLKNDCDYIQGFPDLTVLYRKNWAVLETKRSEDASHQPNQDEYVEWGMNNSFGAFIYPENEEEVLNDMERSFQA